MAEYVKRGNADVGTAAAAGAGAGEVTFLALEGDDVNQDVRPRNGLLQGVLCMHVKFYNARSSIYLNLSFCAVLQYTCICLLTSSLALSFAPSCRSRNICSRWRRLGGGGGGSLTTRGSPLSAPKLAIVIVSSSRPLIHRSLPSLWQHPMLGCRAPHGDCLYWCWCCRHCRLWQMWRLWWLRRLGRRWMGNKGMLMLWRC